MKSRLLVFLSMMFALQAYAFAESQVIDRVIAVVNEDAITQSELDMYLRPIYQDMKKDYSGEQLYRHLDEIRKKLLNQLIEDRLVYLEAKEKKIEITEEEIQRELDTYRKKFKTEQEFDAALKQEGLSLADLKDRLRRQAMIQRLHDMEVRSRVLVSPSEVEEYYKEHEGEFDQKDEVRVRSITIKKSDESREKGLTDEKALKKIKDLRSRIQKGEDFGQLATQQSEDYQAASGGLSDWIQPGSMISVIDDVIFKLEPQQLSEIIETPMGYHIFKVEEKKAASKKSFEDVRDEIREIIFRGKAKKRFSEWMEDLKRKAYIAIR